MIKYRLSGDALEMHINEEERRVENEYSFFTDRIVQSSKVGWKEERRLSVESYVKRDSLTELFINLIRDFKFRRPLKKIYLDRRFMAMNNLRSERGSTL